MSQQTKPLGWFSRRHQSGDAHNMARAKYLASHGPVARRERANARTIDAIGRPALRWECGHVSSSASHSCSSVTS